MGWLIGKISWQSLARIVQSRPPEKRMAMSVSFLVSKVMFWTRSFTESYSLFSSDAMMCGIFIDDENNAIGSFVGIVLFIAGIGLICFSCFYLVSAIF